MGPSCPKGKSRRWRKYGGWNCRGRCFCNVQERYGRKTNNAGIKNWDGNRIAEWCGTGFAKMGSWCAAVVCREFKRPKNYVWRQKRFGKSEVLTGMGGIEMNVDTDRKLIPFGERLVDAWDITSSNCHYVQLNCPIVTATN